MENFQQNIEPLLLFLRPYTHHLPPNVVRLGSEIIGPLPFQKLVMDLDFFDNESPELIKIAISRLLGVAIISASSIVKLPQILKISKTKNVNGLSLLSYILETLSYLVTCSYNFRKGNPFSTFGESAFLSIQNFFIIILILAFTRGGKHYYGLLFSFTALILYTLFGPPTMSGVVNNELLSYLLTATIPLSILSKIPQLISNYKSKSTGQLSGFSVLNYNIGSLSRIFTTLVNNASDQLILAGYLIGGSLNLLLALQMIRYGFKTTGKLKTD
ncbi:hypothetical protein PACTADRAFT_34872 [Pachysolen tannophilus NRRL Y-2460]|uniref:Mannose-P-dolichol utilization defect 1 protein homolog n=1 Tax=Pachysolen tannophilus NRRL Y-2460 TaxID=669874 RepID=A0A1E4TQV3_PACTA|nr:hypothetical protein PACTADRAFT_34872 [Pachysolen tannophilus NRRL Y-2460]